MNIQASYARSQMHHMWEWHHRTTSTRDTAQNSFSILIARTAREHEALMARNMMSNHTDMQDKYRVNC